MNEEDKAETTPLNTREAVDEEAVVIENEYEEAPNKFPKTNGGAGVLPMEVSNQNEFKGLSKKELMAFADDPFWVKMRLALIIIYWIVWIGMLVAAVVIIIFAPKCAPRPNLDWWQTSVGYQLCPRSFKDSNDDGYGDLKGVEQKLDYLKDYLNVSMILMNPIYLSNGFGDASDYMTIDPVLGTKEDFDRLLKKMHKRGMRLILDFVPNHTSKNHTWFRRSRESADDSNQYRDYYVWSDGVRGRPQSVNNWLSTYGDSAWQWDDSRHQYYLHQFANDEPDLNLSNPAVINDLEDMMTYWLTQGVDGVRIKDADRLFEGSLHDDERVNPAGGTANRMRYNYLQHNITTMQPETYKLIAKWRGMLDSMASNPDYRRLLMVETSQSDEASFLEYNDEHGAHIVFNQATELYAPCDVQCLRRMISSRIGDKAGDSLRRMIWSLGNSNVRRLASRIGLDKVVGLNMMVLTLPGIPFAYYGDELGMIGPNISQPSDSKDPIARSNAVEKLDHIRDSQLSPMQWTDQPDGGFCDGCTPWEPVGADRRLINVKTQRAGGSGTTPIEVFAGVSLLRKAPSFLWGDIHMIETTDEVLSYVRHAAGFQGYLIAINFGTNAATPDFYNANKQLVSEYGKVAVTTANFKGNRIFDFAIGNRVALNGIFLEPNEGVIFALEG